MLSPPQTASLGTSNQPSIADELALKIENICLELRKSEGHDATTRVVLNELWQVIQSIEDARLAREFMSTTRAIEAIITVRPLWAKYISTAEAEKAREILSLDYLQTAIPSVVSLEGYCSLSDELGIADYSNARTIAVVGCGPYPETALTAATTNPALQVTCVDSDESAVETARSVIQQFDSSRRGHIEFVHDDALTISYGEFDIVFVANGVRNKADVVEKMASDLNSGAQLLVRQPRLLGELLYESIDRAIPGLDMVEQRQPSLVSTTTLFVRNSQVSDAETSEIQ